MIGAQRPSQSQTNKALHAYIRLLCEEMDYLTCHLESPRDSALVKETSLLQKDLDHVRPAVTSSLSAAELRDFAERIELLNRLLAANFGRW